MPMLPSELAHGSLSLNQGERRSALSLFLEVCLEEGLLTLTRILTLTPTLTLTLNPNPNPKP